MMSSEGSARYLVHINTEKLCEFVLETEVDRGKSHQHDNEKYHEIHRHCGQDNTEALRRQNLSGLVVPVKNKH